MSAQGGRRGIVVCVVGIVLVILGVIWSMVIFPMLDKVPTDYGRTYHFDGSFSVLNAKGSMDTFPIEQTLVQKAIGTKDGAILIDEKRTVGNVTNPANPIDISARYGDASVLAVDRHTLAFATAIDERHRIGQWGPPRGLGKGDTFDLWNPGAGKPLTARYVEDSEFRGLKVVIFKIEETNLPIGTNPQTGAPLFLSTTINQTIDPRSGVVVNNTSVTTTSMDMGGNKIPVQISNVNYAESTIVDLMKVAKDADSMLLWLETVIPWVLGGVGAILVLIGLMLMTRKRGATA
jgi:hypothetical protein